MKEKKEVKEVKKYDEVLTPEESARFLGVSRRTVDRACKAGKITKYTINDGQRVFYRVDELKNIFTEKN